MTLQLSETARKLIPLSKIVSFAGWEASYPKEAIAKFQAADDEGRYLSDADLQFVGSPSPELVEIAGFLRDNAAEIVAEAREHVLVQYPDITSPGGELYPPVRAEACWRDFWHFLRCITYGIAGGSTQYTSDKGLHYMELLYRELGVPIPAMVLGLEALKAASLKRLDAEARSRVTPYFDHLLTQLRGFTPYS